MTKSDQPEPADSGRLNELSAMAQHARQRYSLYKARVYGAKPSSPVRLDVLKRDADRAALREARARADA